MSDDINELKPLTPNLLLKGEDSLLVPEPLREEVDDDITWTPGNHAEINLKYKHRREIKENFIKRWEDEYLSSLRERHKNLNDAENWENCIKVGDIVLIHAVTPRLQ